ncbi:MAG TPA: hypothetical protein VLX30_09585 [Burkholderiales bacterium]|nr:hypothetical protein [Burkholderiales bacterium]
MTEDDRQWKGLFIVSGVLLILTCFLSLVVAWGGRTLYASGYPPDPASYLGLVSQHEQLASMTWSLWIVLDFISLPPMLAIYIILKRHSRSFALLGFLFCVFYAIYDVCVTELSSLTLVRLSQVYADAATSLQQASALGAATYAYYALPYQTVLSFAIGPIGYLLSCVPMAMSFFGRWVAFFGAIVSVIGLLGAAAPVVPSSFFLGLCQFICVRAIAIWSLVLGIKLLLYAVRLPAKTAQASR